MANADNELKKVVENATKEAANLKLNEEQSKLYVDEAVANYKAEQEKLKADETKKVQEKNAAVKNGEIQTKKIKKYVVCAPVKNFNGEVAGVQFAYGKAEVRPGWILNWFKEKGYTVEEKEVTVVVGED